MRPLALPTLTELRTGHTVQSRRNRCKETVMRTSVVLVVLLLTLLASAAPAVEPSDRPDHVDARQWIRISEGFGFVVVEQPGTPQGAQSRQLLLADPSKVSAQHMPPKKGYFVIRTSAGWQPVVITEPTLARG
jgi:hypothetical protein